MIREIRLQNFQAHSKLRLAVEPGLNVIIGQTDQGKSTVIRAIRWIALHEPVTGLVRWGETDMRAGILTDLGPVTRFKDGKKYGYKVCDQEYVACGKDQPKAVQDVLNLTEINFQSQHDSHFLLSLTPGQVAKEINQIVSLADIDKANTWLKSKAAKLATLIQASEDKVSEYKARFDQFADIDDLTERLAALKELRSRIEQAAGQQAALRRMSDEIESTDTLIQANERRLAALNVCLEAASRLEATKRSKLALESFLTDLRAYEALPLLAAAIGAGNAFIETDKRLAALRLVSTRLLADEKDISNKKSELSRKLASGEDIVKHTKNRIGELTGIVESLTAARTGYTESKAKSDVIVARLAELERPSICRDCGKCIQICERC